MKDNSRKWSVKMPTVAISNETAHALKKCEEKKNKNIYMAADGIIAQRPLLAIKIFVTLAH
jgi:hypothetical protein